MMIRRAEERDLSSVEKLLSQVLEIHASLRPDLFVSGTRKYKSQELLEIFKDDMRPVFVAEEDGIVLGYCFCIHEETKNAGFMSDKKTLYIDDLCVDENARGKHVGQALYEYVVKFAQEAGYDNLLLNVWEGNENAMSFYKKMGFFIRKTTMEKTLKNDNKKNVTVNARPCVQK